MGVSHQWLAGALGHYCEQLACELQGVSRWAERRYLAQVFLCRWLLIYDLQVGGWLGGGDRWYLHNQLGQQPAHSSRSFFQSFLQPLCHQGLSLPLAERPQAVQTRAGHVPYLSSRLFTALPLEQQNSQLDLPDEVIERFLGWLAEQVWQRDLTFDSESESDGAAVTRSALAAAWEALLADGPGKGAVTPAAKLSAIAQQTVDALILKRASALTASPAASLSQLLDGLDDHLCSLLIGSLLPDLSMLDPACGSGRFLVMTLTRLQWVYQACWDYAQSSSSALLQDWVRSLQALPCSPMWALTRQILTQNLYGIDGRTAAIVVTQTQLWLHLLSTADPDQPLPLLPDLDFNILTGNSLMGLIRVDEESFDRIAPKQSKGTTEPEIVWQGNLLQPLAAASYRDTLAEKQIRVEHYRAQTQAMGAEGGIPEYVQREFLRDRIEAVNVAAQEKLDSLLWAILSRQMGILVKEPQLSGRARKRLLSLADVSDWQPIHWGFVFNKIISQGGFDLIITQPPTGTLRPRVEEFYLLHEECFVQLAIPLSVLRRSRRQVLQQHPDLADRWSTYAGRINCLRDYVRRSDDYAQVSAVPSQRSITWHQLFTQRCQALVKAGSVSPYVQGDAQKVRMSD
ncbi:MAG: hypothetical protein AAF609_09100 [Cyanobacteria bacterium P01_C01_bin.120]